MTGARSRKALPECIAARHAREQAVRDRNEAARRDIKRGLHRGVVMATHGLSVTAFEQLATQVRGGFSL